MHILLFLVIVLGSVFLLPEGWIVVLVKHGIALYGEGEMAMRRLDVTVLLVKTLLSGVMAYALLRLFRH
ncbi:hypothetical protein [Enterobacter asburiae]|uniref:hypothetical protein n=1 Tax=Enterobacter cloacae complex TaxID=354276 RepID=UPI001CBD8EC7|nr:hypothetical protein [Enterobacter asburiae]UAN16691.1 hypothetical protein KGP20_02785 [Enterobacter asburiae]